MCPGQTQTTKHWGHHGQMFQCLSLYKLLPNHTTFCNICTILRGNFRQKIAVLFDTSLFRSGSFLSSHKKTPGNIFSKLYPSLPCSGVSWTWAWWLVTSQCEHHNDLMRLKWLPTGKNTISDVKNTFLISICNILVGHLIKCLSPRSHYPPNLMITC